MSATSAYSTLHRAMLDVGREHRLAITDVRLLVALAERGGTSTTDVLWQDLLVEGTTVRRSVLVLRPVFLTGGDRRGRCTPIILTDDGRAIADAVLERVRAPLEDALVALFDRQASLDDQLAAMRSALARSGLAVGS